MSEEIFREAPRSASSSPSTTRRPSSATACMSLVRGLEAQGLAVRVVAGRERQPRPHPRDRGRARRSRSAGEVVLVPVAQLRRRVAHGDRASGRPLRPRARRSICCDLDFHRRALTLLRAWRGRPGGRLEGDARGPRSSAARSPRRHAGLQRAACASRSAIAAPTRTGSRRSAARRCCRWCARCIVGHDVFASELVIRAQRDGVPITEIPVELAGEARAVDPPGAGGCRGC